MKSGSVIRLVSVWMDMPLIKSSETGVLEPATWPDTLQYIRENIPQNGAEMMGLAGDLQDIESMVALKDFMNLLGCNNFLSNGWNYDRFRYT